MSSQAQQCHAIAELLCEATEQVLWREVQPWLAERGESHRDQGVEAVPAKAEFVATEEIDQESDGDEHHRDLLCEHRQDEEQCRAQPVAACAARRPPASNPAVPRKSSA